MWISSAIMAVPAASIGGFVRARAPTRLAAG